MSRLQASGVGKVMSRGEGRGRPGTTTAMADSLSIRGTGHSTGSFTARSPIHGSSPSYLAGSGGGGSATNSTSSNNSTRSVHHRGIGGSGNGHGGVDVSSSRHRPRNSSFSSSASSSVPGSGRTGSSGSPASDGQKRGGDVSNISRGAAGSISGDRESDGAVVSGNGSGTGAGSLRPWTARQRQIQRPGHQSSPRFNGSGWGSGGSEPGSDEVGQNEGNTGRAGAGAGAAAAAAAAAATVANDGGGDLIKIHVCDESRGITRDFPCERRLLLREMKYFQSYLVGASSPYDEIDILVHCDVRIFEWLFQYIHSNHVKMIETDNAVGDTASGNRNDNGCRNGGDSEGGDSGSGRVASSERADGVAPPPLEVPLVVSILISSDFLQMQRLVADCLRFVGEHLTEIVKLPIDLSCLSDKMVLQLAKTMSLEQLAVAKDRKDKLLSRVHKKRIELDFRDRSPHSENAIHCCHYCAGLFSEKVRHVISCPSAPPTVGFRGELLRRHEVLSPWSLTRTVTSLHRKGMSWTAVYWFLWGLTQPLYCTKCCEVFLAGDIGQCRSHPQEARFPKENVGIGAPGEKTGDGYYPCCNKSISRFNLEPAPPGCMTCDHSIRDSDEDSRVLRVLRLQRQNVSYEDWRDEVRRETSQAIKSVTGPTGDFTGDSRGQMVGLHAVSSNRGSSRAGGDDRGGGGSGGSRGEVLTKRQPSAGSSRRPPRGPDIPAAVVTTTTTTTTTTIATTLNSRSRPASPQGNSSGGNGGGGSGTATTSSPLPAAPVARRPASAGSISGRGVGKGVNGGGVAAGRGGGGSGGSGGGGGKATAIAVTVVNTAKSAGHSKGGGEGRAGEAERGESTGDVVASTAATVAAITAGEPVPATEGTATTARDGRHMWEARVAKALSARERGLLPNEHPLQRTPLQQFSADWDTLTAPRDCSRMGEGQARRWQTDSLRESDGLRMAQMCDDLRRKRRR